MRHCLYLILAGSLAASLGAQAAWKAPSAERHPGTESLVRDLFGTPGQAQEMALEQLGAVAGDDGFAFDALVRLAERLPQGNLEQRAMEILMREEPERQVRSYVALDTWAEFQALARRQPGVLKGLGRRHLEWAQPEELPSYSASREHWFRYYTLLDLDQDAALEPMAARLKRELKQPRKSPAWEFLPLKLGSVEHRLMALKLLEKVGPQACAMDLDLESLKEAGEPRLNEAVDRLLAAFDKSLLKGKKSFLSERQIRDFEAASLNQGGFARLRRRDPLLAAYLTRSRERIKHGAPGPTAKEVEEKVVKPLKSPGPQ